LLIYAYTTSFFGSVLVAHGIGQYAGGFPDMILDGEIKEKDDWDNSFLIRLHDICCTFFLVHLYRHQSISLLVYYILQLLRPISMSWLIMTSLNSVLGKYFIDN
jgi:hypothetical protein